MFESSVNRQNNFIDSDDLFESFEFQVIFEIL